VWQEPSDLWSDLAQPLAAGDSAFTLVCIARFQARKDVTGERFNHVSCHHGGTSSRLWTRSRASSIVIMISIRPLAGVPLAGVVMAMTVQFPKSQPVMAPLAGPSPSCVRHMTIKKSARLPLDVNHLWPLMTHSSPSRRALVLMARGSEPG